jgi:hypothetical protein
MDSLQQNNDLSNGRSLLHQFLDLNPSFVAWIENTRLFHALKENSLRVSQGLPAVLRVHGEEQMEFHLNGKIIETVYDLPLEIIAKFLQNYPETGIKMTNEQLYLM